jgi:L-glyceraldehyde reductase
LHQLITIRSSVVHWPVAFAPGNTLFPQDLDRPGHVKFDLETTLTQTWKGMIGLSRSKVFGPVVSSRDMTDQSPITFNFQVRSIGVSNFGIEALKNIIEATGVVPAVNQVEAHPLLPQDDLVAYCKEQNIHLTAYSPLGNNSWGRENLTTAPEGVKTRLHVVHGQLILFMQ